MIVLKSAVLERWLKGKGCFVASVAVFQSGPAYYSFSKYSQTSPGSRIMHGRLLGRVCDG